MTNSRIDHLRTLCKHYNVDAFLASSNYNIYYLSGFGRFLKEHDGYFLVTPTNVFLITSPLYAHAVKKYTPQVALLETSPDKWYTQHIKDVVEKEHIKTIGFEEEDLRVGEYFDFLDAKLNVVSIPIRELRIIKDHEEIDAIQTTCALTDKAMETILPYVKVGVSEKELAVIMKRFLQEHGGDLPYEPIVAFGENAAVPHHMISDEKLESNGFVLFDFVPQVGNYLADMSRTVFIGSPTDKQVDMYNTVRESQEKAREYIDQFLISNFKFQMNQSNESRHSEPVSGSQKIDSGSKSGMTTPLLAKDVDDVARKVIEDKGYPTYPHALGHGIGLEVHEAPTLSRYSKDVLDEGMVFTLEPGIYFPGIGGVRIEDMYAIHKGQLQELTHAPKELIVL